MPLTDSPQNLQATRSFIVATAGHVDHGKTSLVRALTGVDTDTLSEEKQRGLTINLGFAYKQEKLQNSSQPCLLGFVDVPGHRDFIHNMLAGVGTVHAALVVIAADDGIMPQTIEHLAILDLLGVRQGVIAISKCDSCEEAQIDQLQSELKQRLAETTLANAPVILTSSKTSMGVETLRAKLLDYAENTAPHTSTNRLFRYQIDRSFSVKGIGTVVTGAALAGSCQRDDLLCHSRTGDQLRVRSLRLHETDIERVTAGERAALNIAAANSSELKRGDWLHNPRLDQTVYRFDAAVKWLPEKPPSSGAQYHLHIGAAHHLVSVRSLTRDPESWMQIRSQEALAIHFGDRFILRDPTGTQTIAGGYVVDTAVPRKHRASPQRLAALEAMNQPDGRALAALLESSEAGVDLEQFQLIRNLSARGMQETLEEIRNANVQVLTLTTRNKRSIAFSRSRFEALSKAILHSVRKFHDQHPSQTGIAEPQLSKELEFAGSYILLQSITEKLTSLELLHRAGNLFRLPDHRAKVSEEERFFDTSIRPILEEAGTVPPRTRELAETLGIPLNKLLAVLKVVASNGQLIKVAENRYFLPDTLLELATLVEDIAAEDPDDSGFSVIQFRDSSNIGRNLCIEILEYFDNRGFTRRDGNTRYLRTDKENIFS